MAGGPTTEPWHLDKRVPIALILTLLAQTVGIVWWAASLSGQVQDHGRRIGVMEAQDMRAEGEARRINEILARLDERMQAQTQILRRLEETLARYPHPAAPTR
jgi:hypothetical protein